MMFIFLRRLGSSSISNPCILSRFSGYFSIASLNKSDEKTDQWVSAGYGNTSIINHQRGKYHSLSFWQDKPQLDSCEIKVVDSDTWRISSGLARISKGVDYESGLKLLDIEPAGDAVVNNPKLVEDDPDFDEIEDMRIYGNLFYKIDRSSMEFEEYKFNFHRKKSSSNSNNERDGKNKENPNCDSVKKGQIMKGQEDPQTFKKKKSLKDDTFVNEERLRRTIKESYILCAPDEDDSLCAREKRRTPTFNQLTGPYHEPFCLDIYVSKGSVRACVVHRATSKVVAVAHSISKDMMFDIGSAKSKTAAAAVGKVLAHRALADDIHNVIFTPRKGDKLEGKLQIVLQSIIDNGVNVKVKLKQRNPNKPVGKLSKSCKFGL